VVLHAADAVKVALTVVDDSPDIAEKVSAAILIEDGRALLG